MRIDRVEARAFGPFTDAKLDLAPGMTVIHGPNESGKSSWHAALYAALCGMRRGGGQRKEDGEFKERHRPWDGDRWEIAARITLDDGRSIELHHELDDRVDCQAIDLTTGADVSNEVMNENTPDVARYLGLDRRTFLSTVCVRQTDTLSVLQSADDLQEQLQRAAATGGQHSTAEGALRRLDAFQREQVGTTRRNATKPLRQALDAVDAAEQNLAIASAAHDEYLDLVRERDRAADEARLVEELLTALQTARQHAELSALEDNFERLQQMAAGFPDGAPPDLPEDDDVATAVADAIAAYRNRPARPDGLTGPSSGELEVQLVALPPLPDGDLEPSREILAAEDAWERAVQRLEYHDEQRPADAGPADAGPVPSELRQAADDLETRVPEVDPALRQEAEAAQPSSAAPWARTAVVATGAVVAAMGVALLAVGQPAVGAALGAGGVVVLLVGLTRSGGSVDASRLTGLQVQLSLQEASRQQAIERRDRAAARCSSWGVDPSPDALRRLARQAEDTVLAAERLANWKNDRDRYVEAVTTAESELRGLLTSRGVPGATEPESEVATLMTAYQQDCHDRAAQHAEARRRDDLEARLNARRDAEASRERALRERHETEARIRKAAIAAGVDGVDAAANELLERLQAWQSERATTRNRLQQAHVDWATYQEALSSQTLQQIEDEIGRHRAELVDVPIPRIDPPSDINAEIEQLGGRLRDLGGTAHDLRGQVAERERTLSSVSEAEEKLEQAKGELDRVQRLHRTLRKTMDLLDVARDRVQRDIAPVLADALTERLHGITDGRYTRAIVDPATLEIRVRSSSGKLRNASLLSQGTAEQIYLLLRLAMAEHLITTDERAPFVLDDALVQTDSARAAVLLDLLHDLSADRQVIVFSQEDDVLTWARERLHEPQDRLVELDPSVIAA